MTTPSVIDCSGRPLDLSQPRVMGVLNVTPDSFSDGGAYVMAERALARAHAMVAEGADLIDVGGESTRPGAEPVSEAEELRRVLPLIEALAPELAVPVSVDTSKPGVMRRAVAGGAGLINDVFALRQPGALEAAADLGVPVCLMHMQGEPRTMQQAPRYDDVVTQVMAFLEARLTACAGAGIEPQRVLLDPGFGFGKTLSHNLTLLRGLGSLLELGRPLLIGLSRKSMIDQLAGVARPPGERVNASVAAAVIAALKGASIVRCHDVAPTVEALQVVRAVEQGEGDSHG